MILSDFNAISIACITGAAFNQRIDLDENIIRHIIISKFRDLNKRLAPEFGDHIICCDRRSWRREYFEHYKANRRNKKESPLDWEMIFRMLKTVEEDFREHFPFTVVAEHGCEADDLIAAFCKSANEPVCIVSKDHDFFQLLNSNVHQYDYSKNTFFPAPDNAMHIVYEHSIRGDSGDGVPNIFSAADTFVQEGKRQSQVTEKRFKQAMIYAENDFKDAPSELKSRWDMNKKLVQLVEPHELAVKATVQYYDASNTSNKMDLTNFFIQHKMMMLMGKANDFFIKQEIKPDSGGLDAFFE